MKLKTYILLSAIFLFNFSLANAADYYVAVYGNDSNPGTEELPWLTLKKATNTVIAGDTVFVKAGKFMDSTATHEQAFNPVNSGTSSNPITFKSSPQFSAILVAPHSANRNKAAMAIMGKQYIIIDGFKVEGLLSIKDGSHNTIKDCDVIYGGVGGSTDPSLNWGIVVHTSSYNTIINNYVHNITASGNTTHNTAAIMALGSPVTNSNYNSIENNIADCGGGIVYSAFGQKGGAINYNTWKNNLAKNCTTGFLGMGSTDDTQYSTYNYYHNNIIINATKAAFELDHNCTDFDIYNNLGYNIASFFDGGYYLESSGHDNLRINLWNNIIHTATNGILRKPSVVTWTRLFSYINYNAYYNTTHIATFNWGGNHYSSLASWQPTGFDNNSLITDPLFKNISAINFRLKDNSSLNGKGRYGEKIGAYANGTEIIGNGWEPSPPINLH